MKRLPQALLLVGQFTTIVMCLLPITLNAQATSPRLAWDEASSAVTGYAVTIDGVRVDYGLAPVAGDGTCGCSVALPFSGGNHTLIVSAYDSVAETASSPFIVAPVANPGGAYTAQTGSPLTVDGSASSNPTGNIVQWLWNWGDASAATTASTPTATHVYGAAGTFTISLTVTDNGGATATATTTATIATTTSPPPLPSPWLNQDVGATGRAGSASFAGGVFTVQGSGADIWGNADAFQYVYQSLAGDGQIVARVTGLQNTSTFAKAGVMLRETTAAGAVHVILDVRPNGSLEFMTRQTTGGVTTFIATATQAPPTWLKLVRAGSTVTGYALLGGAWTTVGSTNVTMSSTALIGMAVTSADSAQINTSTFDNVAVTSATPPPPPPGPTNIVIYASDIPPAAIHGMWTVASDPTSPNSTKLVTPDNGFSQTTSPLAAPADFVDVPFTASAGIPYTLWLRTQALNNSKFNDSLWVQFSDALVNGLAIYPMNSTAGLTVNLATDSTGSSLHAWGWDNGAYWLAQPVTVTFATSGAHTLRIQVREDGVQFDQIVLSPTTYLNAAPGPAANDSTIVPKS